MASSENLASIEPWLFRNTFADSWFSEAYARDAETLTKALQKSMSDNTNTSNNSGTLTSDSISQFFGGVMKPESTASPTPTASNVSGSEPETVPKRQRSAIPVSGAGTKATKRKSRASKRSQTTFITADPANFRQMVQQVTGVKFSSAQVAMAPVLKPEPQRLIGAGGCLPTLDTSAFLLDRHHQQQVAVGPTAGIGPVIGSGPVSYGPTMGLADGGGASNLEFDTFPSFPTLESWKVM